MWGSLVPRPSPKSRKRVWCSERYFLSHGVGPYFVKNVIFEFLYPELKFLMPLSIWTYYTAWFAKAQDGCKVYWNSWKHAVRHVFIISDSFQNMIAYIMQLWLGLLQSDGDLKSEIGPAPCDKKCCSEHQTLFARARGSGHETKCEGE